MSDFLPYGAQRIDDDDIAAVTEALRAPLITQGPLVERFEEALAGYVQGTHVSVCANGTVALELAYGALGLGAGDEIITTPITFSATASAAVRLGARVRFADVEPDTGNLDVASVAARITPATRGIVAVHLAGLPADMAALRTLADRHGLWLVEDAAHALGACYGGVPVGSELSLADATTFSFHPVKHLTCGEGGAISVKDAALKRAIDQLRHHGIERDPARLCAPSPGPWYYEVQTLASNARLPDLACALGLSQLRKQAGWLTRRREIAARYQERLAARFGPLVQPQAARAGRVSAYHLMIVLVDFEALGVDRATVMNALRADGIGTQVHYIPLPHMPLYQQLGCADIELPGAEAYYRRTLSIPMYPALGDRDVDRVIDALGAHLEPDRHVLRRQEAV